MVSTPTEVILFILFKEKKKILRMENIRKINGQFGPAEKILSTQQWLLYSIQRITVSWKFKEQNIACKQGNKVNVVKISPYTHTHYHGFREGVNPTTMEIHMQVVFLEVWDIQRQGHTQ